MKNIKALWSLHRLSVFLIALPYLAFNIEHIVHSPFFSVFQLILFLVVLLIIDVFFKWLVSVLYQKKWQLVWMSICFFELLFFYGVYIANYLQGLIHKNLNVFLRGRTLIEIALGLFFILLLLLRKKNITYRYFNYFMLIFSFITLSFSMKEIKQKTKIEFNNNYTHIEKKDSAIKPILLIISDEYNAPDNLFKVYNDSAIYHFSNQLVKSGWIVKNSFYSYETSTIHSLSSLFNFNLSSNSQYSKQSISEIGSSKLIHASIADSLKKKEVQVINFGIFHIGASPFLSYLYQYPKSFLEELMLNTIYYTIKYNTDNFDENGLDNSFYPMENHNKYIFNHLQDTLGKLNTTKTFLYAHLYMPHSPMQYNPDFPLRTSQNLTNYYDYWNFTNKKLTPLLTALIKENKYRIIFTGDHGYRGDKRINPHYTFTAFFGFEQSSIDHIKSVQDLGSLIISEY